MPDPADWRRTFDERMRRFAGRQGPRPGEITISIKVRVVGGCFHREHSPRAYEVIDQYLTEQPNVCSEIGFVEHESGPELLIWVAAGTAVITLAKGVIDLITAILRSRTGGVRKGDTPREPLEIIVRRTEGGGKFLEEFVMRIGHDGPIDSNAIERKIEKALSGLVKKDAAAKPRPKRAKR